MQPSSYTLTRFLYAKDEVILSLVHAFLEKKSCRECYYWAFELFYSGENIFHILWTIYFDFYAELNPKLESYMRKKQLEYQTHQSIDSIACIIRNIYASNYTDTVFMLRQCILSGKSPTKIFKGRPPTWVLQHEMPFRVWLMSIEKRCPENIAYYTKQIVDTWTADIAFQHLMLYFTKTLGLVEKPDKLEHYWDARPYPCDIHAILSTIVSLSMPVEHSLKRNIYIRPTNEDLAWIMQSQDPCRRPDILLGVRRVYHINPNIGAFQLSRNTLNYVEASRNHWEYYSARSLLWQNRIMMCQGVLNHVNCSISFSNDDMLEKYYALFGVEFDEQPLHVQNKSIAPILKRSLHSWWDSMFACQPIVQFPENYTLKYY